MTRKIGIYGSNIAESDYAVSLARRLGRELAHRQCIVITGACSGMPYLVAHEAHQQGDERQQEYIFHRSSFGYLIVPEFCTEPSY